MVSVFEVTPEWTAKYPGASIGVLAMREVENPGQHPALEARKLALEDELRARYRSEDRQSLRKLPVLAAYDAYYRTFGKTYHVQHQLESIAFKGKHIPTVAALVEAMFMAELRNLLLTAGHDLGAIEGELQVDVAAGSESYVGLGGQELSLKAGDMMISDRRGVVSSILYGPDQRTRITPETHAVIFTAYAPAGISREQVQHHLQDIHDNVRVVSPQSLVELMEVFGAD